MSKVKITSSQKKPKAVDPQMVFNVLREELGQGVFTLINNGADTARLLAPWNVGTLRGSITAEVLAPNPNELASGILYTGKESEAYAAATEYGAKPHWAPIKPLKYWAKRKGGDERLAYVAQRSIAKKGTRAQPYFGPATDEMRIDGPGIMRDALNTALDRLAS